MAIGASCTSAKDLFSSIIKRGEIDQLTVKGVKEKITLGQMCHPLGWLSHWMIKSDEYSVFLTGRRLWEAGYIADNGSIEGVSPVDLNKLTENQNHESYTSCGIFNEEENSSVLKYLIAKHALYNTVDITGHQVSVKPIRGFFGIDGALKNGDPLPLVKEDLIVAIELNRMICNFNRKRVFERAQNKAKDLELDSLGI